MPIDLTTVTEDTRNTSDFELMPSPPLRDVTPKHTGTKKAQLCDQLNLICHSNAKQ
ncbi:hypothetical protein J490_3300 [Acinetobacter baumannii 942194]|nr:hypothetical protein J490_3300 [Acinetobacter baumannii 942194]